MQGLGATKNRLRNLLLYTDELLSFNEKVTIDLAREPYPHFHEFQVARLEGGAGRDPGRLGPLFLAGAGDGDADVHAPSDADATFAAVLHPWVTEHHIGQNEHVAKAGKTWLATKGL